MHEPIEINSRLLEELKRFGNTPWEVSKATGIAYDCVWGWFVKNRNPRAFFLSELYDLGCDVIYILTGERHARS